jgi:hypothetical protein
MNFKEAVDALNHGSNIRRKVWQEGLFLTKFGDTILCFIHEAVPFNYSLDIINSNDWVLYCDANEDPELLSFTDALEYLSKDFRIKLVDWPDDCYLELEKNKKSIFMKQNSQFPFIPTTECFLALDWEITHNGQ